jgi:lysophospholipase L1-like esterase
MSSGFFARATGGTVTLILAAIACVWAPAAHASTGPIPLLPYTQCPAVGASPSCKILLVGEPDSSVTIYEDPSVGDYDGGDDTLVGIKNQSGKPIDSITVTGPGSDLGGLDGDGLCTFGILGCPFGPTGYEGPLTQLVTDPSQPDSAEVDFPGGLPDGFSTYFSLEGTLTSAALTARGGHLLQSYIALGDSYSAGEGNAPFLDGSDTDQPLNHCHRSSTQAYSELLSAALTLGTLQLHACSGAITADFTEPNHEGNKDVLGALEPAQTQWLDPTTKWVTLTVGGNDLGFGEVAKKCVFARFALKKVYGVAGCSQNQKLLQTEQARIDELAGDGDGSGKTPAGVQIHSIFSVLEAIHQKAPQARIYIADYPELFGTFKGECGVGTATAGNSVPFALKITGNDAAYLNVLADRLDAAIAIGAATARSAGIDVTLVKVSSFFAKHRLCDSANSWIKPATLDVEPAILGGVTFDSGGFHPIAQGQQAYESAFLSTTIGH